MNKVVLIFEPVLELGWGLGELLSSNVARSVVSYFLLRLFSLDDSSGGWGTCRWHSNAQVSGVSYSAGWNTVDNDVPCSLECVIFILP